MLLHICPLSIGIKQIFLPFTLHCPLVLLCLLFVFISQSFPQSLLQSPKFSPWPLAEGWKQAQIACPCLSRESKQPKAKSPCSPLIKMFHQLTWIQRPPHAQSLIRSPWGEAAPGEPETSPLYLHPAVCGGMLFSTGGAWLMQHRSPLVSLSRCTESR